MVHGGSGNPFPAGGAGKERTGRGEPDLPLGLSRFSKGTPGSVELVAAGVSGDLAYTVAWERASVSWEGGPVEPSTLRVTHIYRREDGEWKIVHRHGGGGPALDHLVGTRNRFGDRVATDQSPPAEPSTE